MLIGHTSYHAKTETLDLRAAKFLSADGEAVCFLNGNALLLRRQHWRKPVRKHCRGIWRWDVGVNGRFTHRPRQGSQPLRT